MGNMPAFEAGDFPVRGRACKWEKVSLPEWSSGSRRQPAKLLRFKRIAGSNPASGFLFVPRLRPTGRDTLLKTANCVGSNPVTLPIL